MNQLRPRQLVELGTALGAAILGVVAVVFVVLGPIYSTATSIVSSDGATVDTFGTASLVGVGLSPVTAVVLTIAIVASIGIGLGGFLHVRTSTPAPRRILAVSTVVLLGTAFLGILSIGVFLLPSVGLGFVALAAGGATASPTEPWPHP